MLEDPLLADDDVLLLDEVDDGFVALFAAFGSVGDEPSPVALLLLLLLELTFAAPPPPIHGLM